MKGYLGNEAATQETIRDGWMHSGDIAYYDEGMLNEKVFLHEIDCRTMAKDPKPGLEIGPVLGNSTKCICRNLEFFT